MYTYGKAHCKNQSCGASWNSITQLRKARQAKGQAKPICPKCDERLTKQESLGKRNG